MNINELLKLDDNFVRESCDRVKARIRWCKQHECCVECKGIDSPHKGHGLCRKCYFKQFKRLTPERDRIRSRERYKKKQASLGRLIKPRVELAQVPVEDSLLGKGTAIGVPFDVDGEECMLVEFSTCSLAMPKRELKFL